jgi:hypothetical protein
MLASERMAHQEARAESLASRNCKVWSIMGFLIGGMVAIALV